VLVVAEERNRNDLDITVKVKTNMKFSKIFEAAEVCCHSSLHLFRSKLKLGCRNDLGKSLVCFFCFVLSFVIYEGLGAYTYPDLHFLIGTFKFTHEGQRVGKEDTPASVSYFLFFPTW